MQLQLIPSSPIRAKYQEAIADGYSKDFGSFVLETMLKEMKFNSKNKKS